MHDAMDPGHLRWMARHLPQGRHLHCPDGSRLFDDAGTETRLPFTACTGDVWHAYVPGIGAGQRYGYRLAGPWYPAGGAWANPGKLLLDPWSKAIDGGFDGDSSVICHVPGNRNNPDTRDSAAHVPRSVVVDTSLDWGTDKPPGTAMSDSVIYETHVRGLTKQHSQVPDAQKGTYAAVGIRQTGPQPRPGWLRPIRATWHLPARWANSGSCVKGGCGKTAS